jgi:hypothetical protein
MLPPFLLIDVNLKERRNANNNLKRSSGAVAPIGDMKHIEFRLRNKSPEKSYKTCFIFRGKNIEVAN